MKKLILTAMLALALTQAGNAQNINWRSLKEGQRNIVQINPGFDFGFTAQVGYARSFEMFRPVIAGIDITIPSGNDLFDDFKVRLGGQMEVVQIDGFSATIKILGVFRRYQSDLVRVGSFGADMGLVAGYYQETWYAAGEFGFDKAVATNLRHTALMKSMYPGIRDGWYVPTGGHYYFGVQGGKTLGDLFEISLRGGYTRAQKHDENAVVPYYAQLGVGVRF